MKVVNKNEMSEFTIKYYGENSAVPVVIYISGKHSAEETPRIYEQIRKQGIKFSMCEVLVDDWDSYLTPWPMDGEMNGRSFKGRGPELKSYIETELLSEIDEKFPFHGSVYIAGYSLAGLFALWVAYEMNQIEGVACCSGSLWYPGWVEYVRSQKLGKRLKAFISLGKKEPSAGNQIMRTVGNVTEMQYQLMEQDCLVESVCFQWNNGGHFANVNERVVRGITWLIEQETSK